MPYISNYCFIIEVTNLDSLLPLVARESQAQLFSFSPSQHAPPMMRTKNKVTQSLSYFHYTSINVL